MRIKVLKTSVAEGKFVAAGRTVDVSDSEAKALIMLNKAVAVEAEEAPANELTTENTPAVVEKKLKRGRAKTLKG